MTRFKNGVLLAVLFVALLPGWVVYLLVRPWMDTELALVTVRRIGRAANRD